MTLFADGPTKEGLVLFSDFVEEKVESPEDIKESFFENYLKGKGYKVKAEEVLRLVQNFLNELKKYVEDKAFEGYDETQIRALISREKKGLLGRISSTARSKIAGLFKDHIGSKVKEYEERKEELRKLVEEAKRIVAEPTFIFSNWENLAKEVLERVETKNFYSKVFVAKLFAKHSEEILEEYYKIPIADEETIKETLEFYDLEEFETLEELIETVNASVIQKGYRPTKVRQIATEYWKKYQEERFAQRKMEMELEEAKEKTRELVFFLLERMGFEETKVFLQSVLKEAKERGIIRIL